MNELIAAVVATPWAAAVVLHFFIAHLSSGGKRSTWNSIVYHVNAAGCILAAVMFGKLTMQETPPTVEGFLLGLSSAILAATLLRIRVRPLDAANEPLSST